MNHPDDIEKATAICKLYHGEHEGECGISNSIAAALTEARTQGRKGVMEEAEKLAHTVESFLIAEATCNQKDRHDAQGEMEKALSRFESFKGES